MTELDPVAVEADKFANQLVYELSWLVEILRKNPPSSVLEIGVEHGGSMWAWAQVATDDARLMGIDAALSGNGFEETVTRWPWPARAQQTLCWVQAMSQSPEAVAEATARAPFDFLFIDADHALEPAKLDFELYSPLVHPGGIVGCHDVVNQAKEFWAWIKQEHKTDECVDPNNQGCGMGVIYL
jgi:predicted O-methyltransferase YrrM